MLGISYETWVNICKMYFSLNALSTKAYLQWFPFTKVSDEDKKYIMSQDFYKGYIETSSFVFFSGAMQQFITTVSCRKLGRLKSCSPNTPRTHIIRL